jgi:hypothetical protein
MLSPFVIGSTWGKVDVGGQRDVRADLRGNHSSLALNIGTQDFPLVVLRVLSRDLLGLEDPHNHVLLSSVMVLSFGVALMALFQKSSERGLPTRSAFASPSVGRVVRFLAVGVPFVSTFFPHSTFFIPFMICPAAFGSLLVLRQSKAGPSGRPRR